MKNATRLLLAVVATLGLASGASAGCFTVLDAGGKVLSQTSTAPVDMSHQLHEVVPARYGQGATMVFGVADPSCGPEAEPYEDVQLTPVVLKPEAVPAKSRARRRAPRADRG